MLLKKTVVSGDLDSDLELSWSVGEEAKNFDMSSVPNSIKMSSFVYDMISLSMGKDQNKVGEWLYDLRCKFINRLEAKRKSPRKYLVRDAAVKVRLPKTKSRVKLSLECNYPGYPGFREDTRTFLVLDLLVDKVITIDTKDIENNLIERSLLSSRSRSDK